MDGSGEEGKRNNVSTPFAASYHHCATVTSVFKLQSVVASALFSAGWCGKCVIVEYEFFKNKNLSLTFFSFFTNSFLFYSQIYYFVKVQKFILLNGKVQPNFFTLVKLYLVQWVTIFSDKCIIRSVYCDYHYYFFPNLDYFHSTFQSRISKTICFYFNVI